MGICFTLLILISRTDYHFSGKGNNTKLSRNIVGKNVHATIPKRNMGYDQYTVSDNVAVESTFAATSMASRVILSNFFEKQ